MKDYFKPEHKKKLAQAILALCLVVLSITGSIVTDVITTWGDSPLATPEQVQQLGTTHFTNLQAEDLTATDDLSVTDDSTLTDDVSVGGDLALVGALTAGGTNTLDLVIFEHTALTATTTTITPTHTFYSLDTAGNVTVTLAAAGTEGQLLILINDDANQTIIADTNLISADGSAITLTNAEDMVFLIYQDDKWHEIASPDGS